jgi:hypothetical protein
MRTHWNDLILVWNDAGVVHDAAERRRLLEELRTTGRMDEAFLTRTWNKHEVANDRRTWGPTRREIDWSGFEPPLPPAHDHPADF